MIIIILFFAFDKESFLQKKKRQCETAVFLDILWSGGMIAPFVYQLKADLTHALA